MASRSILGWPSLEVATAGLDFEFCFVRLPFFDLSIVFLGFSIILSSSVLSLASSSTGGFSSESN